MSNELLPKLALGTWLMGGTKDPDPNNNDQADISVIQTAINNGVTLIDTAQNYAGGKCEELVGQAVATYPRNSYQILTKQIKSELTYDEVIKGCRSSLRRMGIEYIDYFVCHAPSTEADMRDFFKAANRLYKDGLIRYVGVSNFGPNNLQIALDTSDLPISLNQVSFSLTDDDILTTETYDFCLKNNIPVQAYRTLVSLKDDEAAKLALGVVAASRNITVEQAAIAYLNSYQNMNFTIRSSSAEHWRQIKDALSIGLSSKEIDQLKQVHKNKKGAFRDFLLI